MAFLDALKSWLFGPEETEEPAPAEETLPHAPSAAAPQPDPTLLQLPQDHAVYRLWRLCQEERPSLPPPLLRLQGAPEGVDVGQELGRLRIFVTTASARRMAAAAPKDREPEPLDAQVLVQLSRDRLAAWLLVFPPLRGGRELDRELLDGALAEAGVSFGVDEALLEELPQSPERYFHLYPAARGQPAHHGKDGSIVDMFSRSVRRKIAVDENGRMDYTNLDLVQNVEPGDVICRILPPGEGEPGTTVQGEEIPAKDGRRASVPKGRNTAISEDGSALVASRAGLVEFTGRSFEVKPLLEIDGNVDFSTGNINFLGDVHIRGDVCAGFTVRAMGNISVDGVVEACSVEAGGDLVVAKGVLGNDQAVIRAHRNIYVKYLENCSVYAREDLQAECVINCEVCSDGRVTVTSGRGTIIGGCIRAAQEICANIIGAKSETPTLAILGGQPCEDFERELLARERAELTAEAERVSLQPESPAKLRRMSTLRMKLAVNQNKLDQFDQQPPEEEEEARPGGRLICGTIYPGTEIRIGGSVLRMTQTACHCTAMLQDGEIGLTYA